MIRLHALGGPGLRGNAGAEVHSVLAQPKRLALLAYLALTAPGQFHRRDSLLALFWPEANEERARGSLRTSLSFLRRSLGEGVIETRGSDEVGLAAGSVWCDAKAFADAVQAGRWAEAFELYRGPLLPGFALEDAPAWEEWLEAERARLDRLHAKALQALAEEREVAGDHQAAAELWRLLVGQDPFSSRVALRLMGALEAAGERAEAIQHAAAHAEAMREQLGAEPDPQVLALAEVLRTAPMSAAPEVRRAGSASPPSASAAAPAPNTAPAPAAASSPSAAPPPELPLPPTPLLGREAELTAVLGTLMRESVRLLTLTGPGGIGKTRLALAVAREAQPHFADGAYFVDLAALADPALVLPTAAEALGVREAGTGSLREVLREHLAGRSVLLVLDNLEHLLEAASDLPFLLSAAPRLKLLVTSREPLHLQAEHEHPVPPLARYPASELFATRARAVRPSFEVTETNAAAVTAICTRLDGLPLAIELAAARVKLLPPAQILARLEHSLSLLIAGARDLPPRHRTLRATIQWSHELLGPEERTLFQRLAVFAGGWNLHAAESVCGSDAGIGTLDGTTSLLDKSLLLRREDADGDPRFAMLETIREYARERLEESGEAEAMRCRHAQFFLALAEQARNEMLGPKQAYWLRRLEEEHDNLRAALRWMIDHGQAEITLRLASALRWFWYTGGYLTEGRQWLSEVLAMATSAPLRGRAETLYSAAAIAFRQTDYPAARGFAEESLELFREVEERPWIARALNLLGNITKQQGDLERAEPLYQESLLLQREVGDEAGIAFALCNLGTIAQARREYDRAAALYEEGIVLTRGIGDLVLLTELLGNLGTVVQTQGDTERAATLFREGLRASEEVGHRYGIAWLLGNLAGVAVAEGEPLRAARLFGAAEALFAHLGTHLAPEERAAFDLELAAARSQLEEAVWQRAWAEGQAMTVEEAIRYALEEKREYR